MNLAQTSRSSRSTVAIYLAAFFFQVFALSAEPLKIPPLSGPVMDDAHFLSAEDSARLEAKIRSYEDLLQIQVWTVKSLQGEPIESLTIRATDQWKLGTESKDNGVLILIAVDERNSRIEVGRGLEGDIPDITAKRIISDLMVPAFQAGDPGAGLLYAVQALYKAAGGEISTSDLPVQMKKRKAGPVSALTFFLIFLFIIFMRLLFRSSSYRGQMGRSRWGGMGGFGGGGGGFGGWTGGGGSFGGGGASGRW